MINIPRLNISKYVDGRYITEALLLPSSLVIAFIYIARSYSSRRILSREIFWLSGLLRYVLYQDRQSALERTQTVKEKIGQTLIPDEVPLDDMAVRLIPLMCQWVLYLDSRLWYSLNSFCILPASSLYKIRIAKSFHLLLYSFFPLEVAQSGSGIGSTSAQF